MFDSFGESTGLLHSFQEQFNSQSGAKILQQFSFEQKKTKIAQVWSDLSSLVFSLKKTVYLAIEHSKQNKCFKTDIFQ